MIRRRRQPSYQELEFNCELEHESKMDEAYKADLIAMWSEVLFDILEEA